MDIYNEIINWSLSKPPFYKDAIRRFLHNGNLNDDDFQELKEIIKKTNGFPDISTDAVSVTIADVPHKDDSVNSIRLVGIYKPVNISALYKDAALEFAENGLTIIYGKNGTGKSSYSKILKKVCWSRDKNIELKKNVYNSLDSDEQSFHVKYKEKDVVNDYVWNKTASSNEKLNNVYVFDSKCAQNYLSENSSEYKPAGIDVLEKLISLFNKMVESFRSDINSLHIVKPKLDEKFNETNIAKWYSNIENLTIDTIEAKLFFPEEKHSKLVFLEKTLNDRNLEATNKNLQLKSNRYVELLRRIKDISVSWFCKDKIKEIILLKTQLQTNKIAYELAVNNFETDKVFDIGGNAWRNLWNAAREYAIDIEREFPLTHNDSNTYCILCQQPLSDNAKERLTKFNLYIQDKSSTEYEDSKRKVETIYKQYVELDCEVISKELETELISDNHCYAEIIKDFKENLKKNKTIIVKYLKDEVDVCSLVENTMFCNTLEKNIEEINSEISSNDSVIKSRNEKVREYLEIQAEYELNKSKDSIIEYLNQYHIKCLLDKCINSLNTKGISAKIGDLLNSNSIEAQQNKFMYYLNRLNPKIAEKIVLSKTRTVRGVTFQQCIFNQGIQGKITDVFSEGELKIVSLANFLSECVIDNIKRTIVFDDPVNSLDIDYRETISKIIDELSSDRQVIVFTHDLYFVRLLKDNTTNSSILCLNTYNGISGIKSDEIPYLSKNVQERINSIRKGLNDVINTPMTQIDKKHDLLNDLKDKMRQLLERTVEDILVNKTVERFSKNVSFKKGNLANIVVTDKNDTDFLLSLYSKYSEVIHDGSIETIPSTITEDDIQNDIRSYSDWKNNFTERVKAWKGANGY